MSTPTTHSPETLAQMKLPELWDLYEQVLGQRTKAPNRKFLVNKILEAQAAQVHEEAMPAPAAPEEEGTAAPEEEGTAEPAPDTTTESTNPWAGAVCIDDRIALLRQQASTEALDALLATAPAGRALQARVVAEASAQRQVLTMVQEAATPALRAMLGNKRTHSRPGVLAAVKARMAELGADEADERPLDGLSVDELRAVYESEVGRPTKSTHKGYLIWKIREARKGKITVGEVQRGGGNPGAAYKVLAIRMEVSEVEALDAAWKAAGLPQPGGVCPGGGGREGGQRRVGRRLDGWHGARWASCSLGAAKWSSEDQDTPSQPEDYAEMVGKQHLEGAAGA